MLLSMIKFFYQWLLPPAGIILALAGLNVYMYRRRAQGRYALSVLLLFFYFLSIRLGESLLVWPLEHWYLPPHQVNGDVLLMLGNGTMADAPDLDGKGQPYGTMGKNMLMTLRLQRATGLPVLISGGGMFRDNGIEADIAQREFIGMGMDPSLIYKEGRSRNTVENVRFSRLICEEQGWHHPIVLVVALQAPRTAMIFAREGMDVTIYPTHYRQNPEWHFQPVLDVVPSADFLADSSAALREYMGIAALKVGMQ